MASASAASPAPSSDGRVKIVLGTMEFGRASRESESEQKCREMVATFVQAGHNELDTALMYTDGESERILGRLPADMKAKVKISTKVNPWRAPDKALTPASVKAQAAVSLKSLQTSKVDILYLHAPDHKTPIEDTLAAMNELYVQGSFERLGLSNYAAWQVADIYHICKEKGYPLPTVYQGMYNPLTRDVEAELFPCLRRFGIAFYAYNPLAGGLLTDRYKYLDADKKDHESSRFFGNSWAEMYRKRYWHQPFFQAIDGVNTALDKAFGTERQVRIADAAIRWMLHHSRLNGKYGDAVIFGASSMKHTVANLASAEQDPLPKEVVKAFDEGWELTKSMCPQYFR